MTPDTFRIDIQLCRGLVCPVAIIVENDMQINHDEAENRIFKDVISAMNETFEEYIDALIEHGDDPSTVYATVISAVTMYASMLIGRCHDVECDEVFVIHDEIRKAIRRQLRKTKQ